MKFLDTYESILIWQLRNGIKVDEDHYVLLLYQIGSWVLTTSEDQGQYQVVLGCHHSDRWGSERLITMGNLSFKSNYYSCFFRFGYISCFLEIFRFFAVI